MKIVHWYEKVVLWSGPVYGCCQFLTLRLSLQRTDLFNSHPRSLQYDRLTDEPKPEVAHSRFRQLLLSISGFYSKESQLLRGVCLCRLV